MDFPVESVDAGSVVAVAGIAVRDRASAPPGLREVIPEGNSAHLHAAVFGAEPLSRNMEQLENELRRVVTELDARKVQHLLGRSTLASGLAGIIDLAE
jgi:hypothetical protein